MRIPSRGRGGGLKFNLTPLIDVVFNLIIFFLAASHLARSEIVAEVELPEAETGRAEAPELNRRLIVTILPEGIYNVGGKELALPQIEQMLAAGVSELATDKQREFEVRIRSDRRVPYRQIEPLLLGCARAGITNVHFNVVPAP